MTKTVISEADLKQMICAQLGEPALLTIHRHAPPLFFSATVMTMANKVSAMQARVDNIVDMLRINYALESDDTPKLASDPGFVIGTGTVHFEFWNGGVRQRGTLKLKETDTEKALRFFHQNWRQIGRMAADTPPSEDEVVELVIAG